MNNARHRVGLAALGLVALTLGGCGKTLVFGERSGVNIALRFDTDRPPPVEVNIGLERRVGTIVPPTRYSRNNEPSGDAVSMFSGFQVESFDDPISIKPASAPKTASGPFNVDVLIGTQFASGAAAVEIAKGAPEVVASIVNVGSARSLGPVSAPVATLFDQASQSIRNLGPNGRRCLARALNIPAPATADTASDNRLNLELRKNLSTRKNEPDLQALLTVIDEATKTAAEGTC